MLYIEDLDHRSKARYQNGLVLSGGGAKGFAHIGILRALNEKGIFPDIISGTSAGAIVGSLYADGHSPEDIFQMFKGKDLYNLVQIVLPKKGLFKMKDMLSMLKANLKAHRIEDLAIKTYICTTNFSTGKVKYFYEGPIIKPVIASASIPVLFQPILINEDLYVDGGMFANLPVEPLIGKCKRLIGVHVNPFGYFNRREESLTGIVERVFQIGTRANVLQSMNACDWFIEPPELKKYGMLSVKSGTAMHDIGYEYTLKYLEKKGL
ncbi:MAG: patatin-like phospholipase family protein [Bacteroidetes bacterium]|jgi:NTE family protein|nr:patatin-like phospholipase family protein [Bacteroidota bacterium]